MSVTNSNSIIRELSEVWRKCGINSGDTLLLHSDVKRGFGYKMVQQAINKINEDYPSTKMIEAKVKESNIASNKIFLGLNFYEQGRVGQVVIYQLKLT